METGPVIAGGRAPLVIHLLAPNHRPAQVTTELAGFWRRVYPQVRKGLSRHYPRHAWPENPLLLILTPPPANSGLNGLPAICTPVTANTITSAATDIVLGMTAIIAMQAKLTIITPLFLP